MAKSRWLRVAPHRRHQQLAHSRVAATTGSILCQRAEPLVHCPYRTGTVSRSFRNAINSTSGSGAHVFVVESACAPRLGLRRFSLSRRCALRSSWCGSVPLRFASRQHAMIKPWVPTGTSAHRQGPLNTLSDVLGQVWPRTRTPRHCARHMPHGLPSPCTSSSAAARRGCCA